jgi:outer membrane protein assembly factor BamB
MRFKLILLIFMLIFLTLSAVEHRLGLLYQDPKEISWLKKAEIKMTKQPLPCSLDYSYGMPPVGYQYMGSCVAWAFGYYYKGYQEYVDHDGWDMSDPDHQFHAKFIYNMINGGRDGGAYFGDGLKCLLDFGVAPYSSVSYTNYDSVSWPTEKAFSDAIPYRCEDGFQIPVLTDAGIDSLKKHMFHHNDCAVIGIYVYQNFDNIGAHNNIFAVSEVTGDIRGGHALCLVGYNDSLPTPDGPGAFRLVNSWSTSWGDNGYAWITYEALKSAITSYQWAFYATDKKNYQPTTKVAYKVSHDRRLDIQAGVVIGPIASPHWQSPLFFDWYQSKKQQYPHPSNAVILDITDGAPYLSYNETDTIYIKVLDTDDDEINGVINDFSASNNIWSFYSPSPDTPMVMLDVGYTNLKLYFPDNKYHWQSFHRLADNSGFIDLFGDADPLGVSWIFPTNDSIESSPIIADIDGDDTMEVVVGSDDDTLYAVNADGSILWKYGMGDNIIGAPAAADLDLDGKVEVVASSINKRIVSLNGEDGSLDWEYNFIGGVPGSPAVNFIDSDRKLEVVGAGTFMRLLNGESGSAQWLHYNGTPSKSSPAVGDVYDANGRMEIVVGQGNLVRFFDGVNGDVLAEFVTSDQVLSSAAIGDLDGDSLTELVIGSNDDTLYALEMDSLLWNFGTNGDVQSSPALADIDNDSKLEVVFGSNDGNIYALNAEDGSLYWSYPTGGEVISSPALADLDGNGVVDVVVGSKDGYIYAISGDGTLFWNLDLGVPITSSPALGDIDNDGLLEVAIGGLDGNLYVVNGVSSGIEEENLQNYLYLYEINKPVLNGITIKYNVPERGNVNLSIFDITGREIRNVINKVQNAGQYSIRVNTERLPNGVYFYRLTHGYKSISRKMVVLR